MTTDDKRKECDTCSKAGHKRYARETVVGGRSIKTLVGLTCCRGMVEWIENPFDIFPLQFNPAHKPGKCDNWEERE